MRKSYDRIPWDKNSINARFFNEINMNFLDNEIERLTELALQEKLEELL